VYFKIRKKAIPKYQNILRAHPNLWSGGLDESGFFYVLTLGTIKIEKSDCVVVKRITPKLIAETFERR